MDGRSQVEIDMVSSHMEAQHDHQTWKVVVIPITKINDPIFNHKERGTEALFHSDAGH